MILWENWNDAKLIDSLKCLHITIVGGSFGG